MTKNTNIYTWHNSVIWSDFWFDNLIKILSLPKDICQEYILNQVNTIEPYLKIQDITFVINEKDRIQFNWKNDTWKDNKDKNIKLDCYNPENEKLRIQINWKYIWNFLVSNTPLFNTKTLTPKIQYFILKILITSEPESYGDDIGLYKTTLWIDILNNVLEKAWLKQIKEKNLKKHISDLSKTLHQIFNLTWKPNDIIKYSSSENLYKAQFNIKNVDEKWDKESEREKFKKTKIRKDKKYNKKIVKW